MPFDLATLCLLGVLREPATGKSPFSWGPGLSRFSALHITYLESVPSLGCSVCSPHLAGAVETGWSTPLHTGGSQGWRVAGAATNHTREPRAGWRSQGGIRPASRCKHTCSGSTALFSPLRPAIPPPRDNDQGMRLHPQPPRAVIPLRLLSAPAAARPKLPGKRRWMAGPSGLKLILHSAPATSPLPGEQ